MIAAKDYEVGTNSLCENTYSLKGRNLLEGFRFEDEDYINFKFSRLFSRIDTTESFIVLFSTTKVSTLICVEEG